MAIATTPLGFKKPDGNESIRNGNDVISDNAQTAEQLHAAERARLVQLEASAGFPGTGLDLSDQAVNPLLDTATTTRAKLDGRYANAAATTTALAGKAATTDLAGKVDKGSLVVNVLDYGAKGDWNPYTSTGTDDTAAIQAAIDAVPMGGTVFFPGFGNSRKYLISSQINITRPNVRLMGAPRDTYASAVRMNVATGQVKTMFMVKTTGIIFENLGIEGGGGQITGVEVWGDNDGNCDTRFSGVCFTRLFVGTRTRGRNVSWINECIFSISTEGVVIDGPDAVYHTGASASTSQRGYKIDGCLFHGNGSASTQGSIRFTPESKTKYAVISNNSFDGGGKNSHVIAAGTSANPIQHLHITDNTHNDMNATAYDLTWVQNSTINGANIAGTTSTAGVWSNTAINLANCKWLTISNVLGESIGRHGFKAVSSSYLWVSNVNFNTVGLGGVGHRGGLRRVQRGRFQFRDPVRQFVRRNRPRLGLQRLTKQRSLSGEQPLLLVLIGGNQLNDTSQQGDERPEPLRRRNRRPETRLRL